MNKSLKYKNGNWAYNAPSYLFAVLLGQEFFISVRMTDQIEVHINFEQHELSECVPLKFVVIFYVRSTTSVKFLRQ